MAKAGSAMARPTRVVGSPPVVSEAGSPPENSDRAPPTTLRCERVGKTADIFIE